MRRTWDAGTGRSRFGEELYRRVPSPQTITALAEGYRIAGRREAFRDFVKALPPAERSTPDLGIVLALAARDAGNETARARDPRAGARREYARAEYARLAASADRRVAADAAEDPVSGRVARPERAVSGDASRRE